MCFLVTSDANFFDLAQNSSRKQYVLFRQRAHSLTMRDAIMGIILGSEYLAWAMDSLLLRFVWVCYWNCKN